ncbi:MAG: S8 family serine peptidase [Candidatus Nanopelagicales bacterium]|nr:S8 family serine peptidase [Candidatus Nanopelagicales bacterium]
MRIHAATGAVIAVLVLLVGATAPAAAQDGAAAASVPAFSDGSGPLSRSTTAGGPTRGLPMTLATVRGERLGSAQWGLAAIGAQGAWGVTRGAGITVAVLDSGVDRTHPDLADRLLPTTDLVQDGQSGDPFGHGTRVAGVIAGVMDGAGIAGVASDVRILPIRVLAADGEGDQNRTARAIRAAVAAGAQVINLSLSSQTESPAQAEAIRYALDEGVTVVAAAGNRRQEGSPTVYPAAYPGVLGVSSVGRGLRASTFASRGDLIDLVAPGEGVITTQPGGGWGRDDGTSIAAAFVSAATALVRAANPTLSRSQVEELLLATTRDLGSKGRDDTYGHGLIRVDRAVRAAALLPGGLLIPSAAVTVGAVAAGSKLSVDVDPDLSAGSWAFRVQSQRADGSWRTLPATYRTRGAQETRVLDLPRGAYRVKVPPRFGLNPTLSTPVTLSR